MSDHYDDIIDLPHHVSTTRPQMPMSDRAAQFSPFAALTGYDAAIKETGRLTDAHVELDEDELKRLDAKFQILANHLRDGADVTITYFKPDERKEGGAYLTITGSIKKVNSFDRLLMMQDGTCVHMDQIVGLESALFSSLQ